MSESLNHSPNWFNWVTESLIHSICSKTWIHLLVNHCCVDQRRSTVLLWLWLELFSFMKLIKTDNIDYCLKCSTISVSCFLNCCIKSHLQSWNKLFSSKAVLQKTIVSLCVDDDRVLCSLSWRTSCWIKTDIWRSQTLVSVRRESQMRPPWERSVEPQNTLRRRYSATHTLCSGSRPGAQQGPHDDSSPKH